METPRSPQDAFVKLGQTLKLESALNGEIPSGMAGGKRAGNSNKGWAKSPWEPSCIFPYFPHANVLSGDSWANSNLVLGTEDGTFLVVHNRPPVSLFQI